MDPLECHVLVTGTYETFVTLYVRYILNVSYIQSDKTNVRSQFIV